MRAVVALGGNALARRGEPMTADAMRANVRAACAHLAEVAGDHELVVTHGNGPQVGLLALQNAAYTDVPAYPLDILGAQTQGMIGYVVQQELESALAGAHGVVTVLTTAEIDADDPAFADPTKFVGPQYTGEEAAALAAAHGWTMGDDGGKTRRVVPSPTPRRIRQTSAVRGLLEAGHVVVCVGGGGVPVVVDEATGRQEGREAVIDKDLSSALLAEQLGADAFVMLTDGATACENYGTPQERSIRVASPEAIAQVKFAAGSMQPKVDAAIAFAKTGGSAFIGSIDQLPAILARQAGTEVRHDFAGGIEFYPPTA